MEGVVKTCYKSSPILAKRTKNRNRVVIMGLKNIEYLKWKGSRDESENEKRNIIKQKNTVKISLDVCSIVRRYIS